MSTPPKGYPSQEKEDRLSAEFATVAPAGPFKHALDVIDRSVVHEAGTDTVESGSTTSVINLTAHSVLKGDRIRFTSGTLDTYEVDVWEVDTNTVTLAQTLPSAPGAGDTLSILRPTSLTVSSSGGLTVTPAPIRFTRNGSDQVVTEDTSTPANNRPLPVKLTGLDGDVVINSTNLNLEVQLSHSGSAPDSVQIGDGTDLLSINGSGEAAVEDAAARTSLASIDGKLLSFDLDSGAGTEEVTGVNLRLSASGGSVEAGTASDPLRVDPTGTTTQPISASSLPLPTGAATEATLSSLNGKVTACDTGAVTISAALPAGTNNIGDVDIASSVLPTGAATEVTLASIDGKITACNTGNVTIGAALPAGTNNIGDVDIASALPAGTNNIGDVDIASALPAGSNSIGNVGIDHLDVVDFFDTPLLDASSSNIPASAATPLTVVASLAAATSKVQVADTTGGFIGVYSDPSGTPVLEFIIGPGSDQTIEVSLPATTEIGVRNMENSAISVGNLIMNFMG